MLINAEIACRESFWRITMLMHDPRPATDTEEQPVPETPEPTEQVPPLPHPSDDQNHSATRRYRVG